MTLSGPCVTRPAIVSPVCRSSRTTRSRNSSQTPARTPEPTGPGRGAATPDGDVVGDLEVDHADDPARGGGGGRVVDEGVGDVVGNVVDGARQRQPLGLAQQPGRVRLHAEEAQPGGRGPGAVQVAGDEDDGQVADGRVEQRRRSARRARARRGSRSRRARCPGTGGGARARRAATACAAEVAPRDVEPAPGQRPLREVHVRVPEAGHEPSAVEVDLRRRPAVSAGPTAATRPSRSRTSTGPSAPTSRAERRSRAGRYGPHVSTVEAGYDPRSSVRRCRCRCRPRPCGCCRRRTSPVLLDPERRLAAATAVNIDGAQLVDLERGDDWHLDPRVPADEQAGPGAVRAQRPRPRAPGPAPGPGVGRPRRGAAGQPRDVRVPERRPAGLGVQPGRAALGRGSRTTSWATRGRTAAGCRSSRARCWPTTTRCTAASASRGCSGRSPRGRRRQGAAGDRVRARPDVAGGRDPGRRRGAAARPVPHVPGARRRRRGPHRASTSVRWSAPTCSRRWAPWATAQRWVPLTALEQIAL